jgi:hypothetical protein
LGAGFGRSLGLLDRAPESGFDLAAGGIVPLVDYDDLRLHEGVEWLKATAADRRESPETRRNAFFLSLFMEVAVAIGRAKALASEAQAVVP